MTTTKDFRIFKILCVITQIFISNVIFFSNGDVAFGTATLVLPFLPAVAATMMFLKRRGQEDETCFKKFWKHLPVFQIYTHQKMLREVAELQNCISEYQEEINELKKEVQTEDSQKWLQIF